MRRTGQCVFPCVHTHVNLSACVGPCPHVRAPSHNPHSSSTHMSTCQRVWASPDPPTCPAPRRTPPAFPSASGPCLREARMTACHSCPRSPQISFPLPDPRFPGNTEAPCPPGVSAGRPAGPVDSSVPGTEVSAGPDMCQKSLQPDSEAGCRASRVFQ